MESPIKTALLVAAKVFAVGVAALLVWFLSPTWVGMPVKILLVLLILLIWPAWALIGRVRRAGAARRAVTGGSARGNGRAGLAPPVGTYEELTRAAEEVTKWLRDSKIGAARGGDVASALPLYVIAGPVESGKTSLLLASGMDFHVLPSQRASEQSVIRPTPHVEWRVTDSAIWLDTAGRYQAEGPDRDEWAALVETLKRHRKERAIDGYVVVVSAAALFRMNESQVEEQAKVARARLDEAMQRAGARFPVYLIFTHMDQIEGFDEFFDAFTEEERAQVWGSTIPLAQADTALAHFDPEFDHLYGRLLRRRPVQLASAATPQGQLRVFKFPGRFRRARPRLGQFASALFRPNPFSESPLLRGLYFTGSPGVGPAGARQLAGANFTQSLFRDVLLPDQDVVAAAQAARRSPHLRRHILLGVAAALAVFIMAGMFVSYFSNKRLIANAYARGRRLMDARKVTSRDGDQARLGEELAAIDGLRQMLADLDEYGRTSPPLHMRFGLYSGNALNSSDASSPSIIRHLYFEAVEDRFLKPTVARIEKELRAFGEGQATAPAGATTAGAPARPSASTTPDEDNLGRHYDLLKAYLMLSQPDKVEPTFLAQTLRDYWKESAPPGEVETALRQLDYFATQAGRDDAPHPDVDGALVARAQDRLVAYPLVNRVYKRIVSDINAEVKYPVRLDSIPDAREGNLLSSTYAVPGAFTTDGYLEMTERLKSSVADEFRKDDWVMRSNVPAGENLDAKKDELAGMYYRDYTGHWQRFLTEVKVRDYQTKEEAVRALRLLSGSTSPLGGVLREVARQTDLSAAGSAGVWGWIKNWFASKQVGGGATQVDREFRPLIQFVAGEGESAPLTEYRAQLKKVADTLNTNPKPIAELSKSLQAGNDPIGLVAARQAVTDTTEARGFAGSPAADAAARLLKQPLDNLNTLLVGTDFDQIEKAWQLLQAKAQGFEAGFPFTDGGADISLAQLTQFLNPQDGELTRFVNDRLKPYFEQDWTVKPEAADKFSPAFAAYVMNARRLRDALFPEGKQPKAEYQLAAAPVKDGLVRVEIDGNALSLPAQPSANFTWPGDKSGVRVTVTPTSGADVTKNYPGEWGLLHLFRENGGGDGRGAQFTLQAAGVRLTVQPKSGGLFQRELFAALKAPRSVK